MKFQPLASPQQQKHYLGNKPGYCLWTMLKNERFERKLASNVVFLLHYLFVTNLPPCRSYPRLRSLNRRCSIMSSPVVLGNHVHEPFLYAIPEGFVALSALLSVNCTFAVSNLYQIVFYQFVHIFLPKQIVTELTQYIAAWHKLLPLPVFL